MLLLSISEYPEAAAPAATAAVPGAEVPKIAFGPLASWSLDIGSTVVGRQRKSCVWQQLRCLEPNFRVGPKTPICSASGAEACEATAAAWTAV